MLNRRGFLRVSGLSAGALCLAPRRSVLAAEPGAVAAAGPFSFLVVSDTHYARPAHYDPVTINDYAKKMSAHTDKMWDKTWTEVRGRLAAGDPKPSFVLHLGDYVHGDCPTPEKSLRHYADFVADMTRQELPVPLMLTRGNHDLQGKGVREAYDKHMPDYLKAVAPPSKGNAFYGFDVGKDTRVVVLDVYQPRQGAGLLGPDQLKWLDDDLTAFRKRSPKGLVVVATHYPVFPMTPRGAVFDRDPKAHADLVARLVEYRVALVLCGHLHLHARLAYTDPKTKHTITQAMTYTIVPDGEQKAHPAVEAAYRPEIIADVTWRKPADLDAMRAIVDRLAPAVTGYRYVSVPGYQVVSVGGDGGVSVTAYRGLGQKVYERFEVPRG